MQTVFDIGMYDGADTAYYLESGFRVVGVEANPRLIDDARKTFAAPVASGQLVLVSAAISERCEPVTLLLSATDLGSSSVHPELVATKHADSGITVPGITPQALFEQYGVPHYLKVDIEGADRLCVLSLTREARPRFLSFEVGSDFEELLAHAHGIGYSRFKLINQSSFRELSRTAMLSDRLVRRLVRALGYAEPGRIRRDGRFFVSARSSGPAPWRSDGAWYSRDEALARWQRARQAQRLTAWYDLHATVA
jgi:FkbM family methyltransferase